MMEAVDRIRTFKELRIGSLMSQKQAAKALGISTSMVYLIENGYTAVSEEMQKKINDLFEEETMIPLKTTEEEEARVRGILNLIEERKRPNADKSRLRTFKEIRQEIGIPQKDIAVALGVSNATVCLLEKGELKISSELYQKITDLFDEEVLIECKIDKKQEKRTKETESNPLETPISAKNEWKFLKTCWNMQDALKGGRMIPRDIVHATYEFMQDCEAITYLYKWFKMGFYYFPNGSTVDQGYFLWDKLPGNLRRVIEQ